jgi:hypothetical protein
MEKTAVEQIIDYIEEFTPKNKITDGIWSKAKSLIEVEKQQIIEAYACGVLNECSGTNVRSDEYYNQTYKSK